MIDFLIWFWNAGELLMIIGVSIIIIGLIFYRNKKQEGFIEMWSFVLFCLSLTVTIYFYVKRNKIYDNSENLDNDTLDQYNKLDRMFIIMLLITFGLFGLSTYVLGWFNF